MSDLISRQASEAEIAKKVDREIANMQLRAKCLPHKQLPDLVWNALLALFRLRLAGTTTSVRTLNEGIDCPDSTFRRWLLVLIQADYIATDTGGDLSNASLVSLTDFGSSKIQGYFENVK